MLYDRNREERKRLSQAATRFAKANGLEPRPAEGWSWPKGDSAAERKSRAAGERGVRLARGKQTAAQIEAVRKAAALKKIAGSTNG